MGQFIESTIEFEVADKKVSFKIIHDMPETPGLSMDDAYQNWLFRTDQYTAESLKAYIDSKNTGAIVYTEEQYLQQLEAHQNE